MSFFRFVRENAAFLLAGALLTLTSSYGQTYFISLFAGKIRHDFGLSNGDWGLIYTAGTSASAVVMLWAGALTDRFRVRYLSIAVLGALALSCLGMAAVTSGLLLIGVVFLLRFFGQGMTSQLAVVSMARWFVANRGKALSIATMGFALGQALLPIIFVALMASVAWRGLWLVAAGLVLVAIPPVVMLLRLERTPQSISESEQVGGMGARHWRRVDMLRHPLFWFVTPLVIGMPAWSTALFFHQVHFVGVKGWALLDFVALMPVFTATSVAMNFASGGLVDRLGSRRILPYTALPAALGFATLAVAPSIPVAGVGMMLVGMAQGMGPPAIGAFWAESYGTRYLGAIKATAASLMVFGSAIGPGLTGVFIDHGIAFPSQMLWISAYFVAAAVLASVGLAQSRLPAPDPAA